MSPKIKVFITFVLVRMMAIRRDQLQWLFPRRRLRRISEPLKLAVSGLLPGACVDRVLAADEDTLFYTEPEMTDPMLGGNRNKANALRSGSREIVADRDKQAGVEIVNTAGEIRALTKIGNDYYIADGDGGLVIYHIGNGSN